MTSIGLSIIVSDRHEELERCLEAAQGLYDQLSITLVQAEGLNTKKCLETAKKYNAIISHYYTHPDWTHPFIDDFSAARNVSWKALSKDTKWVFILDSDDIIKDPLTAREIILETESPAMGMVKIMNSQGDGSFIQPRFWSYDDCEWQHRMHEQLKKKDPDIPNIVKDKIIIIHDYEDLDKHKREDRNNTLAKSIMKSGEADLRFSFFFAEKQYINHMRAGMKKSEELDQAIGVFKDITAGNIGEKDTIIVFKSFYFLSDYYSISEERDYIAAIRYGLESLKYNLDDGRPYFTIGRSLYSMTHYDQAIVWLEHAMNLPDALGPFPIFNAFKTYLPIEQIAYCYLKKGEKEKAQGYHSRARYLYKEYEKHDKDFE
jgi:tetratricopeptide (TPR) repeat protein